jgi:hypothetical protein
LTRRLAADLISSSDVFKSTQQFWLRTGLVSNKDYTSPESLVLQNRGWIGGVPAACTPQVNPPPCWDVYLTPLGVEAFRELAPRDAANRQYFSVPIAKRELVGVTGVSRDVRAADVEFTWHWMPLNEVGQALVVAGVNYKSVVVFRHYDDGWRLMETAPARRLGLDEALKNAEAIP